jgi:SAM-dependent methyltransferase
LNWNLRTASYVMEQFKRRLFAFEDYVFEIRHRIDVGGAVAHEHLVSTNTVSLPHATAYNAVWCRNLRELFREARKTGIDFRNFIDVGAGKGKACFYASSAMCFDKIVGIEFSKSLIEIAKRNQTRNPATNIDFQLVDAAQYLLPAGNALIFLFNPFDEVILNAFIENNLRHFGENRSVVAYANDVHRKILVARGFETIFRNQTRKISLYAFS